MNRTTMMLSLLVGIGAVAGLGVTAPAQAAPIAVQVGGGGTALFDDPRFAEEMGVVGTQFGMGVTLRSDGSAMGHFECIVTGGVPNGGLALSVKATSGSVNGDGSVTFSGPAIVHFAGGGTDTFTATVTATAGGPGVGTFCVAPPAFVDTPCDHETVVNGNISIKTH